MSTDSPFYITGCLTFHKYRYYFLENRFGLAILFRLLMLLPLFFDFTEPLSYGLNSLFNVADCLVVFLESSRGFL